MKKTIFGIFFLILLSCSKDDEVIKDDTIINLEVQIAINKPEVYVLEHTEFKFTFNRSVKSIIVLESTEVSNYTLGAAFSYLKIWNSNNSTSTPPPISMIFPKIETKGLSLIVTDQNDKKFVFNFTVPVVRGNAVKVKKISVSNINSLNQINNCAFLPNYPSNGGFNIFVKYPESVYMNTQVNYLTSTLPINNVLTWNLQDLYIKSNLNFQCTLSSIFCEYAYPNMKFDLNLNNYVNTQPTSLSYSFPNYNLSVTIEYEWN